jgi:hypothetical protein
MEKMISLLAVTLLSSALGFGASATNDIVGNWKGTLDVGSVKLRLVFRISKDAAGKLTAKMDSLDQGARDMPVDTVTFKDGKLRMELKSISGVYEGTLDKAGKNVTGQWTQAGQPFPLALERSQGTTVASEAEALLPADLAASQQAAQKLTGSWNGTLNAGGTNLRLLVKISKAASGAATGTMDSLDQGAKDIPLSRITYKESNVRFEAPGIGGVYEGTLASDGATLAGQWQQGGQSLTLDFKKAASAAVK